MTDIKNVAIVGATGMVGSMLIELLEERDFELDNIYFLASERSAGETLMFREKPYLVEAVNQFDFSKTGLVFFCAGNKISAEYAPLATACGNIVIDKSSYFRNDPDVPLVVPEVNPEALHVLKKNIIASPNCSTIPIVMALKPLHDAAGLVRMNVATWQSVSGSGREGVAELAEQATALLSGKPVKPSVYAQQIAFNVLPFIDTLEDNGYTREEMKVVHETRKIFNDDSIAINVTATRVPVFYGHSAAVHIETRKKITAEKAKTLLAQAPGIELFSDADTAPTAVSDAAGRDEVFVGRVREDISHARGLDLWIVADNIRKGAALNAVQIAEYLRGIK